MNRIPKRTTYWNKRLSGELIATLAGSFPSFGYFRTMSGFPEIMNAAFMISGNQGDLAFFLVSSSMSRHP